MRQPKPQGTCFKVATTKGETTCVVKIYSPEQIEKEKKSES